MRNSFEPDVSSNGYRVLSGEPSSLVADSWCAGTPLITQDDNCKDGFNSQKKNCAHKENK